MSSSTVAARYTPASPSSYAPDAYGGRFLMSSPLAPRSASGARSSPTPSSPLSSVGSSSRTVNRGRNQHLNAARAAAASSSSSSRTLKPGPLGLGGQRNAALDVESSSTLARLRRQQFRQKCQEAMARDRTRDRGRKIAQGRVVKSGGGGSDSEGGADDTDASLLLRSDDLSSSDMDEEEEMEYIRRVLAVDYRRMLREQERSGQIEVGWLDPDEVAWLEEEVKREEAKLVSQDVEPPADLADEDEELYAQYQHSQHLKNAGYEQEDESLDSGDDDSWLNNEEWQRAIDGVERALSKTNEDTLMSED